jgi:uncharacterized protein (TIGR03435 family)
LLEERFALMAHHESRSFPIYALTRTRPDRLGDQFRKVQADCPGEPARAPSPSDAAVGCGAFRLVGPGHLKGHAVTIPMVVSLFSNLPVVGRGVVDRTGLDGAYDLELEWNPNAARSADANAAATTNAPSFFTAVQEQLGLKLDATRGPVDVVVIDRARLPTPN